MLGEEVVGAEGVTVEEERIWTVGGSICGGTWRAGWSGLDFGLGSGVALWLCNFRGHCERRGLRIRMK